MTLVGRGERGLTGQSAPWPQCDWDGASGFFADQMLRREDTDGPAVPLYVSIAREPESGQEPSTRLTGPVQVVLALLRDWELDEADAVGLLGLRESEAARVKAVLKGYEALNNQNAEDRIGYLFWIRGSLLSLFQDLDHENRWIRKTKRALGNASPLSLIKTGTMRDLLLVKEHVDRVCGR